MGIPVKNKNNDLLNLIIIAMSVYGFRHLFILVNSLFRLRSRLSKDLGSIYLSTFSDLFFFFSILIFSHYSFLVEITYESLFLDVLLQA